MHAFVRSAMVPGAFQGGWSLSWQAGPGYLFFACAPTSLSEGRHRDDDDSTRESIPVWRMFSGSVCGYGGGKGVVATERERERERGHRSKKKKKKTPSSPDGIVLLEGGKVCAVDQRRGGNGGTWVAVGEKWREKGEGRGCSRSSFTLSVSLSSSSSSQLLLPLSPIHVVSLPYLSIVSCLSS